MVQDKLKDTILKGEKLITLPLCAKLIGDHKKMRYKLKILDVGLIVCKIKIINPYYEDEEFEAMGLIDTGSQNTLVSTSLYEKFTIHPHGMGFKGLSTLNKDEKDVPTYPFTFKVPINNIIPAASHAVIKDFPKDREYDVIIGIDILERFDLYYSRRENIAYLDW